MKKYQGEDIFFSINFNSDESGTLTDFSGVSNVLLYAYTSVSDIVKFSLTPLSGYNELILSLDNLTISGAIESEYTKSMSGQLNLEIMIEIPSSTTGDLKETLIKKVYSGIFIIPSTIKTEA